MKISKKKGEDGTYKDFCRWYGGDCGSCPEVSKTTPDCFEEGKDQQQ